MDKTAIKTFAINSRKKLMEDVEYKMSLVGINKDRISEPISSADGIETYQIGGTTNSIYDEDILKREQLVREVKLKGFENVVEEVAYTWFNRIIAIRFMEINNFLPTKTRVLSSETPGKIEPDIITEAFDIDLDYTQEDNGLIFKLKDENKLDELFRFLFIKQSNKLNEILPGLFEKTDDYLELLLNISFTNEDGVVRQLIDTIPEEDFGSQVEIIGWLYQFYNTELKDETFANLKKRIKISKERIPAATQLFTPDWIVKYMVENSVGRLWLEGHPNEELKSKWKYYVEEAEQEAEVEQQLIALRKESEILKPEDITVIDPCMGSGHILVYVFEVLLDIYVSEGYTEKDACESILKNNLYGLDIDKRAYQLAYFAVLMKARKYNRRILTKNISPLLCSIEETNSISEEFIDELISQDKTYEKEWNYIYNFFKDAKVFGSILTFKKINYDKINEVLLNFESNRNLIKFKYLKEINLMKNILNQAKFLSNKYDVSITNPPYMGNKGMSDKLKEHINSNYKSNSADLFVVMMERCITFIRENGYCAMITQQSWMYLNSFVGIRNNYLNLNIINLLHLGTNTFEEISGEIVKSSSFIIKNERVLNYKPLIIDLTEFNNTNLKESHFLSFSYNSYSTLKQNDFLNIPNLIFMYKLSLDSIKIFMEGNLIQDNFIVKRGPSLSNNAKFLRLWFEVVIEKISFNNSQNNKKWKFCTRNGSKIKWHLFVDEIINSNILKDISNYETQNKLGIVWPDARFGSQLISARIKNEYFAYESGNNLILVDNEEQLYTLLALFNSYLYESLLSNLIDGQHFSPVYIKKLPFFKLNNSINETVKYILSKLKKFDLWIEISPNFKSFVDLSYSKFSDYFYDFKLNFDNQLQEIIGLEIEINNKIEKITSIPNDIEMDAQRYQVNSMTEEYFIKSFISYAVGCMFGRYSLDNEGLQFAGGEFNLNEYSKFIPDDDNIIPVLDSEYFEDDIVGRFVEFVKTCFGEENLEENLDFIADALTKNKKPSREKIRDYLLKNFFNDHKKTYKKCPIYWQFTSGKENGFNCLVYMHRYEPSLVARIRTDYLHKTQKAIEQAIANCDNIINHSSSNTEITKATKEKNKLQKQLKETQEYDEALAHIANQNIEIDLDDGVKVNYAKFQNVEVSKEGKKSKKINLLKKL